MLRRWFDPPRLFEPPRLFSNAQVNPLADAISRSVRMSGSMKMAHDVFRESLGMKAVLAQQTALAEIFKPPTLGKIAYSPGFAEAIRRQSILANGAAFDLGFRPPSLCINIAMSKLLRSDLDRLTDTMRGLTGAHVGGVHLSSAAVATAERALRRLDLDVAERVVLEAPEAEDSEAVDEIVRAGLAVPTADGSVLPRLTFDAMVFSIVYVFCISWFLQHNGEPIAELLEALGLDSLSFASGAAFAADLAYVRLNPELDRD